MRVPTSRNVCPPVQGLLADLNPDLIASWEGGSNQILVRKPARVAEQRRLTLARRPERRRMHWVRLDTGGGEPLCVANLHASAGRPAQASAEVLAAAAAAVEWSAGHALVFGGDLNLRPARRPETFAELRDRFGLREPTAPDAIDHVLARGLEIAEPGRRLPPERRELPAAGGLRLRLSDHAPIAARFVRYSRSSSG